MVSYPKGLMMIPNQKSTDFRYFQSGYGLIYRWNNAFRPRFIFTCSLYLFDSTINDPYEQYKDALGFLKYIFKDRNTKLPSRQELANIVSIAQLIHYGFESYNRTTNEISISLKKETVSKRWKEIFRVNKRTRHLEKARKKVDSSKRIGKKLFKNLTKTDQRERNQAIKSNQLLLTKKKKEIESLSYKIEHHQFNSPTKLRNAKDKRDSLVFEIKRLERTLEYIDPSVQPDMKINMVERHMNAEINKCKAMMFTQSNPPTKETSKSDGTVSVDESVASGGKRTKVDWEYIDWSSSGSYSRKGSQKGIWVKEVKKKY